MMPGNVKNGFLGFNFFKEEERVTTTLAKQYDFVEESRNALSLLKAVQSSLVVLRLVHRQPCF